MILGQPMMGARQTKNAPLVQVMINIGFDGFDLRVGRLEAVAGWRAGGFEGRTLGRRRRGEPSPGRRRRSRRLCQWAELVSRGHNYYLSLLGTATEDNTNCQKYIFHTQAVLRK